MSEEPIIYTTKGNIPESTLDYSTNWDIQKTYQCTLIQDADGALRPIISEKGSITFSEIYRDKETGEIVKQSKHVKLLDGSEGETQQGNIS
jgi:hypothetical protein